MLNVIYAECRKQAHYAECLYAEYRYAGCHYAECRSAIWNPDIRKNFIWSILEWAK